MATTTEAPERLTLEGLAAELKRIDRLLMEAHAGVEENLGFAKEDGGRFAAGERWLLLGFIDDALIALKATTENILDIQTNIQGGCSVEDEALYRAVSGGYRDV